MCDLYHVSVLLFECLSLPLYLRLLYVFCRYPGYSTAFWRILSVLGIVARTFSGRSPKWPPPFQDLVFFVLSLLLYRLPLFPTMQPFFASLPPSRWLGLAMFLAFSALHVQFGLHVALSANRFTGILFPFAHKKFWRVALPCVFCAAFTTAFVLSLHRLFTIGMFVPFTTNDRDATTIGGYVLIPVQYDELYELCARSCQLLVVALKTNQAILLAVFGLLSASICLLLNSATLCASVLRVRRIRAMHFNVPGLHRIEWSLILVTLWTMALQFVVATFELPIVWFQLLVYLAQEGLFLDSSAALRLLFAQIPWICDLCTLSQPWVLLLVCADLRACLIPRYVLNAIGKHFYQQQPILNASIT